MKYKLFILSIILFWFIVISNLLFSSISDNPIIMNGRENMSSALMPQGWSFFTRNPKEERLLIYHKVCKKWERLIKANGSPEYLFGINRTPRRLSMDLGVLNSTISKLKWVQYSQININDIPESVDTIAIDSISLSFEYIKGEYLLIRETPKPWAWADLNNFSMPGEVLKVYLHD